MKREAWTRQVCPGCGAYWYVLLGGRRGPMRRCKACGHRFGPVIELLPVRVPA